MKKNKTYIEKLNLSDFKSIKFLFGGLPKLALDFFKYVTLFDLEKYYIEKEQTKNVVPELNNPNGP